MTILKAEEKNILETLESKVGTIGKLNHIFIVDDSDGIIGLVKNSIYVICKIKFCDINVDLIYRARAYANYSYALSIDEQSRNEIINLLSTHLDSIYIKNAQVMQLPDSKTKTKQVELNELVSMLDVFFVRLKKQGFLQEKFDDYILTNFGLSEQKELNYCLALAAKSGDVAETKRLISCGADAISNDQKPLRLAVLNDHFQLAKMLAKEF